MILKKNTNRLIKRHFYKPIGNLSKMIECFLYKKKGIEKIDINYGINYLRLHNKIFN